MLPPAVEPRPAAPTCVRCKHYWVTHQPATPHGCRAFGIVSARPPSLEIRVTTGEDCRAYEPKPLPPARP
jgi:hypothetical protein